MPQADQQKSEIKIIERDGKRLIYDLLRRKYVRLTPEEWVRQNFVHFLIEKRNYPFGLMANEVELEIGNKKMRADTVLYHRDLRPRMIIEYKSPNVQITKKVFDQIMSYNILLKADYLVACNGKTSLCCHINYALQKYEFLQSIPYYEELK